MYMSGFLGVFLAVVLFPVQTKVPAPQTATITGELSYPSDFDLPQMIVCAEAIDSRRMHCTGKSAQNRRSGRLTYKLRVPAGSYYVFATIVNGEEPVEDFRGYKAYYSEFVRCGLKAECPSHAPVKVSVRAGQNITGINPGDWYID